MQRMIFAFIAAAAISMLLAPVFIPMLRRLKFGQVERKEGPHANSAKEGTPTMGGIMFIISIVVAAAVFSIYNIALSFSIPAILMMLAFGLVGFLDDFIKVRLKRNLGLKAYQKIIAQLLLSFAVAYYAYKSEFIGSVLYDPIFGEIDLGWGYIPFIMFVVIAIVNSANLTDGLDGLLGGVSIVYSIAMGVLFLYFAGVFNTGFAGNPLFVAHSDGMISMAVFAFAVAGGCTGFLKSNSYPAKVFMGDTGSLFLGGAVAALAFAYDMPLVLILVGIVYICETMSDILQVGYFKLTHGKRIFKMAPLHHHFEMCGWKETKIVAVFTTVSAIFCVLAYLGVMDRFAY